MQNRNQVESWDDTAIFLAEENDKLKIAIFRLAELVKGTRKEKYDALILCGMSDQEVREFMAGRLRLPYKSIS